MKRILTYLFISLSLTALSQTGERSLGGSDWRFRKKGDRNWMKASVPGTVHTDLLANRKIPDPFYGTNEKDLQWIGNADWEYQASFKVTAADLKRSHLELSFDGLDTYAKVYINDSLVITADNMFRSWKADVKRYLKKGKNNLYILFESAVAKGKEAAAKLPYTLPGGEKVFSRKAQYQYGWDWGPRLVTCGIWKDVRLLTWDDARILNVRYIQRSLTDSLAQLEFICEVQSDVDANAYLDINKNSPDLSGQINTKVRLKKGVSSYSLFFNVKNPHRWWCNGLGFPTTYGFRIDLSYDSRELDVKKLQIGLRTIELVQEPDSVGTSFYFKLNGIPVFMKGANLIPPDNFLPRVSRTMYENIVKDAVQANMNMIRVWGGGTYADERFYEMCDYEGILVWQDFMFACAMYPGDEQFVENVAEECIEQVRRLRHHPCIALWCGNNEVDEGWKNWGWQKEYRYSVSDSTEIAQNNSALFDGLIRDIVSANDGSRAYWPSSPSIGWGHHESMLRGDSHYWGVWWGMEPFEMYGKKVGRFMSEYGFQGMPPEGSFRKMGAIKGKVPPKELTLNRTWYPGVDTAVLNAHQKHPKGYQTIDAYLARDYKKPVDFSDHIYLSQVMQAEGMRIAIEAHRRAKPYCMGSLYWQLNDCWPVTSWSSIDYNGKWKALHYQVRRSFDDVIVSVEEKADSCNIYVISDLLQDERAEMVMELYDLNGKLLLSQKTDGIVKANASQVFCRLDNSIVKEYNKNDLVLKCSLKAEHFSSDAEAVHYFAKPVNLNLQQPLFTIDFDFCEKVQCFTVSTNVPAKSVFVSIPGYDIHFSDNFFDLLPGERKTITLPRHQRVAHLTAKKIRIRSLVDAAR